ncbi:hypothetical protein EV198_1485 [Roseivirga ehrenbergii]|uniref:DUF493 domain-containing protein n=1 Tax=Roseivirga ehrenbergii (strain DSM 102268 / JCM 13514 / KCTC 12282 / NCIMB 14502 / KMM 6017) TaxID=279360 RepID=A0A150XIN7_ROSEK|nr:DUF493 family protein [Roseivirga ehrenbergii]KYG78576.1 hypothetical protein MB14_17750 [Roseivirga ehrenbergii]TCL10455.1 hypothetical protein EV198_1485 [Roseivirga ehrenbergii]
MMQKFTSENFKEKLESTLNFPALYMFKFIVEDEKQNEVKKLFPGHDLKAKASSKGKYVSITAQVMMPSSDSIIEVYLEAAKIEGIIAL